MSASVVAPSFSHMQRRAAPRPNRSSSAIRAAPPRLAKFFYPRPSNLSHNLPHRLPWERVMNRWLAGATGGPAAEACGCADAWIQLVLWPGDVSEVCGVPPNPEEIGRRVRFRGQRGRPRDKIPEGNPPSDNHISPGRAVFGSHQTTSDARDDNRPSFPSRRCAGAFFGQWPGGFKPRRGGDDVRHLSSGGVSDRLARSAKPMIR